MSFQKMKLEELLEVVDTVGGVELSEKPTKNEIIAGLAEAGITYGSYRKLYDPPTEEELAQEQAAHESRKNLLVKMERKNPTFEFRGYKFTKTDPFEVMTEDDFEDLVHIHVGFRIATPSEAKSFYN